MTVDTNKARNYEALAERLAAMALPTDLEARMAVVIDVLWEGLSPTGVSWIGYYFAGDGELTLGPRRDKPACSPIGLHGACGRAYRTGRAMVVRDVSSLGADYVACDPRDRSEVVVPVFDDAGRCIAVLDADSHDVGAFGRDDADGLRMVLERAEISSASKNPGVDVV